jgi:hypothetical protein
MTVLPALSACDAAIGQRPLGFARWVAVPMS